MGEGVFDAFDLFWGNFFLCSLESLLLQHSVCLVNTFIKSVKFVIFCMCVF